MNLYQSMKSAAKYFLDMADELNEQVSAFIDGSDAPDESTAILIACGLSIGARAFQKTAFTIVYGEGGELLDAVRK